MRVRGTGADTTNTLAIITANNTVGTSTVKVDVCVMRAVGV